MLASISLLLMLNPKRLFVFSRRSLQLNKYAVIRTQQGNTEAISVSQLMIIDLGY